MCTFRSAFVKDECHLSIDYTLICGRQKLLHHLTGTSLDDAELILHCEASTPTGISAEEKNEIMKTFRKFLALCVVAFVVLHVVTYRKLSYRAPGHTCGNVTSSNNNEIDLGL